MTGGLYPLSEGVAFCHLFTAKDYGQRTTQQFNGSISLKMSNSPWVPRQ